MEFGKTNRLSTHAKPGVFLAMLLLGAWWATAAEPLAVPFDSQWRFVRAEMPQAPTPEFDDRAWETVTLPHTAHTEALVTGRGARQWQGICWYRKTFDLPFAVVRMPGCVPPPELVPPPATFNGSKSCGDRLLYLHAHNFFCPAGAGGSLLQSGAGYRFGRG